jgi:hypothetical protein
MAALSNCQGINLRPRIYTFDRSYITESLSSHYLPKSRRFLCSPTLLWGTAYMLYIYIYIYIYIYMPDDVKYNVSAICSRQSTSADYPRNRPSCRTPFANAFASREDIHTPFTYNYLLNHGIRSAQSSECFWS